VITDIVYVIGSDWNLHKLEEASSGTSATNCLDSWFDTRTEKSWDTRL